MNYLADGPRNYPDLILINPLAGSGRTGRAIPALKSFSEQSGWNAELRITSSGAQLEAEAKSAASLGYERILAFGGDGTFQMLLNAIGRLPGITLGIIPGGGGDDLAVALGLPRDPLKAAALLREGEARFVDVACVRTADGIERLYAGGGGVGLDAEASYLASTTFRNWKGRIRYLAAALRAYRDFPPLGVRVTMFSKDWDGPRVLEKEVLVCGALNTPSYGAGLRVAPAARVDDGKLELFVLPKLNVLEIFKLLPSLSISGEFRSNRAERFSIERIRIETARPSRFHGDGEILGMTPVEVEVLPGAIQVLTPIMRKTDV